MINFNEMTLNELKELVVAASGEYKARQAAEVDYNYELIEKLEPTLLFVYGDRRITLGEAIVKVLQGLVIIDAHHSWDFVDAIIAESFGVKLNDFI